MKTFSFLFGSKTVNKKKTLLEKCCGKDFNMKNWNDGGWGLFDFVQHMNYEIIKYITFNAIL